ncbi:DEHA2G23342p [Debaryomyces hansenii CBS767]|uniref:DEHA2G23342p n=1 Tax=Debaryomyces hansenii (strain ATCC 36239 / CBS 767 / BCRC 21394 / JCM 1990 / NBRC 0083 / IGC 2968) TaxID=284592 RepID=B5RUZ9_DEBHA|nr:DEHA2G23342p [Debaryomyces hansenii CBS767]CAR66043.1 DEHA2G23342p [Debaryomyces hansenii CBS767]|eukprot:XP_002777732.1 DEHA2G23342p [Debaryomyces hansenii CBS767]
MLQYKKEKAETILNHNYLHWGIMMIICHSIMQKIAKAIFSKLRIVN